jgi:hypothetical protein
MRRIVLITVLALLLLAACRKTPIGPVGSTHIHADYKVYLDGQAVDFTKREYMVKAQYVHIEGMNGDVIHVHATGVTIGDFFKTLGMKFTNECFVKDKKYCTDEQRLLKFYVNGEPNDLYGDYLIGDQDKMLISYGPKDEDVAGQLASITDHAAKESASGRTMRLG